MGRKAAQDDSSLISSINLNGEMSDERIWTQICISAMGQGRVFIAEVAREYFAAFADMGGDGGEAGSGFAGDGLVQESKDN